MKKLLFVLATSINMLTLSLIIMFSYMRFHVAHLASSCPTKMESYWPYQLIILLVLTYIIELYVIYKK